MPTFAKLPKRSIQELIERSERAWADRREAHDADVADRADREEQDQREFLRWANTQDGRAQLLMEWLSAHEEERPGEDPLQTSLRYLLTDPVEYFLNVDWALMLSRVGNRRWSETPVAYSKRVGGMARKLARNWMRQHPEWRTGYIGKHLPYCERVRVSDVIGLGTSDGSRRSTAEIKAIVKESYETSAAKTAEKYRVSLASVYNWRRRVWRASLSLQDEGHEPLTRSGDRPPEAQKPPEVGVSVNAIQKKVGRPRMRKSESRKPLSRVSYRRDKDGKLTVSVVTRNFRVRRESRPWKTQVEWKSDMKGSHRDVKWLRADAKSLLGLGYQYRVSGKTVVATWAVSGSPDFRVYGYWADKNDWSTLSGPTGRRADTSISREVLE